MAKYRDRLPQLDGRMFLTDGGIETTLHFHDGLEFREMAAFDLFNNEEHRAILRERLADYARVAVDQGVGLVLETATWRANPDCGAKLGYSIEELAAANRTAVEINLGIRQEFASDATPIVISGNIGPRGDGYDPAVRMSADEAHDYHRFQTQIFRDSEADLCTALTINYVDEAVGICRAAAESAMPHVISFTVETDGKLPSGEGLGEAIDAVDQATSSSPSYYMINCAHPTHFDHVIDAGSSWARRLGGLRANSSSKTHEELDESPVLDEGNPAELAEQYVALRRQLPGLKVLGGCCGTDDRHVRAIGEACAVTFD